MEDDQVNVKTESGTGGFYEESASTEGSNFFTNPFDGVSPEESLGVMQRIINCSNITQEELEVRIQQLQNVNPKGFSLCHQKGVLPYNNRV